MGKGKNVKVGILNDKNEEVWQRTAYIGPIAPPPQHLQLPPFPYACRYRPPALPKVNNQHSNSGNLLFQVAQGQVGEVCIQGANVTKGYINRPEANEEAFAGGWFHTGDQGFIDEDGMLVLTGRIKELINRGGEKVQ